MKIICVIAEIYVRARVRSSKPVENPVHAGEVEMAWVQPVVVNGSRPSDMR